MEWWDKHELWRKTTRGLGITWLYIITPDAYPYGPCKIGISENPWSRVEDLNPASPCGSLIVYYAFGLPKRELAHDLEQHFHKWQKKKRLHHEWFDFSPDEALKEVCMHVWASFSDCLEDEESFDGISDALDWVEPGGRMDLCSYLEP